MRFAHHPLGGLIGRVALCLCLLAPTNTALALAPPSRVEEIVEAFSTHAQKKMGKTHTHKEIYELQKFDQRLRRNELGKRKVSVEEKAQAKAIQEVLKIHGKRMDVLRQAYGDFELKEITGMSFDGLLATDGISVLEELVRNVSDGRAPPCKTTLKVADKEYRVFPRLVSEIPADTNARTVVDEKNKIITIAFAPDQVHAAAHELLEVVLSLAWHNTQTYFDIGDLKGRYDSDRMLHTLTVLLERAFEMSATGERRISVDGQITQREIQELDRASTDALDKKIRGIFTVVEEIRAKVDLRYTTPMSGKATKLVLTHALAVAHYALARWREKMSVENGDHPYAGLLSTMKTHLLAMLQQEPDSPQAWFSAFSPVVLSALDKRPVSPAAWRRHTPKGFKAITPQERIWAKRNDWVRPDEIAKKHYDAGVVSPHAMPRLYRKAQQIMNRLWVASGQRGKTPLVFLLESEIPNAFYAYQTNRIYLHTGALAMLQHYQGVIREEDIAFILAHEIGHFLQKQEGVEITASTRPEQKHAIEYDADKQAVFWMNRAAYTVRNVQSVMRSFEKEATDWDKARDERLSIEVRHFRALARAVEKRNWAFLTRDEINIKAVNDTWRIFDVRLRKKLKRRSVPLEMWFSSTMSMEDFSLALRALDRKDRTLLKEVLIAYAQTWEEMLEQRKHKGRDIPFLGSHPPSDERMRKVDATIQKNFMKNYKRPFHPLSKDTVREALLPKEVDVDHAALCSRDIEKIKERVAMKIDSIEAILFLSRGEPSLLSDQMYRWMVDLIRTRGPKEAEKKEALLFVLDILFDRPVESCRFSAISHLKTFLNAVPHLPQVSFGPEEDRKQKDRDDKSRLFNRREFHFVNTYNRAVSLAMEGLFLQEKDKSRLFWSLVRRYRSIGKRFGIGGLTIRREMQGMLQHCLEEVKGSPVRKMKTLFHFVRRAKPGDAFSIPALYWEAAQEWFLTDKNFMRTLRREPRVAEWFPVVRILDAIQEKFLTEDVPSLGRGYEEALEKIYFLVHTLYRKNKSHAGWDERFFKFWVERVYLKFRPRVDDGGRFDHDFVSHLIRFLRNKKMPSWYYAHWIYGLVNHRLGTEAHFRSRKANLRGLEMQDQIKRLQGLSLAMGTYVQVETAKGITKNALGYVSGLFYEGVEYKLENMMHETFLSLEEGGTQTNTVNVEDILSCKTLASSLDQKPPIASGPWQEIISKKLEKAFPGKSAQTKGLSVGAQSLLYLMSSGIVMESRELISHYLENMPLREVFTLHALLKSYFVGHRLRQKRIVMHGGMDQYLLNIWIYAISRAKAFKDWKVFREVLAQYHRDEVSSQKSSPDAYDFTNLRLDDPRPFLRHKMPTLWKGKIREQEIPMGFFKNLERTIVAGVGAEGWEDWDFKRKARLVAKAMDPSVLRNHFLYYLFFEEVLKKRLALPENLFWEYEEIGKRLSVLPPAGQQSVREEILAAFRVIVPFMITDEFIKDYNERWVGYYTGYYRKDFNALLSEEEAAYQRLCGHFGDGQFSEVGTIESYVDLAIGNIFKSHLEKVLVDPAVSVAAKIREIKAVFGRKSNTRDYYLDLLLDKEWQDRFKLSELEKIASMMNEGERVNKARLLALEKAVTIKELGVPIAFDDEIALVEKYFPKRSGFRDDILKSIEQHRVTSKQEIEKIKSLLSSDPEHLLEKEVAKTQEVKDNFIVMLGDLNEDQKEKVLLWLTGLQEEKPACIRKSELLYHATADHLKTKAMLKTLHYSDCGRSDRAELLYQLLAKGDQGIIPSGRAPRFIETLMEAIYATYGIDRDIPTNNNLVRMARIVFEKLGKRPDMAIKVLTDVLLALEQLSKDEEFKSYSPKKKVAHIAKVFLGACRVLGIKMGQHLASSAHFDLSREFRETLLELTDEAVQMDVSTIFSILSELGHGKDRIERVMAAASVKTVIKILREDLVRKIKNLTVLYEAKEDLETFIEILDGFEQAQLITAKQKEELEKQARYLIEEVIDFAKEMENAKRLDANQKRRQREGASHWMVSLVRVLVGDVSRYSIHYSIPLSVEKDVLINERPVEGVSLKEYDGPDKDQIKLVVLVELLSQILIDGFYHADLHPANILVHAQPDATQIHLIDAGETGELRPGEKEIFESVFCRLLARGFLKKALFFMKPSLRKTIADRITGLDEVLDKLRSRQRTMIDRVSYLFRDEQEGDAVGVGWVKPAPKVFGAGGPNNLLEVSALAPRSAFERDDATRPGPPERRPRIHSKKTGDVSRLKDGEIAISVGGLQEIVMRPDLIAPMIRDLLPSIRETEDLEVVVKKKGAKVTFYKRMAGSKLVWAIRKTDVYTVAGWVDAKVCMGVPYVEGGRVGIHTLGLDLYFSGDPGDVFKRISALLPDIHATREKQSTVPMAGKNIVFDRRRTFRDLVWACDKEAVPFLGAASLSIPKGIAQLRGGEVALSWNLFRERFHLSPHALIKGRKESFGAFYDPLACPGIALTITRGEVRVTFVRRWHDKVLVWAVLREDLDLAAMLLRLIPKDATRIASDEFGISLKGKKARSGAFREAMKFLRDKLGSPWDTLATTKKLGRITCFKRWTGKEFIWACERKDAQALVDYAREKMSRPISAVVAQEVPMTIDEREVYIFRALMQMSDSSTHVDMQRDTLRKIDPNLNGLAALFYIYEWRNTGFIKPKNFRWTSMYRLEEGRTLELLIHAFQEVYGVKPNRKELAFLVLGWENESPTQSVIDYRRMRDGELIELDPSGTIRNLKPVQPHILEITAITGKLYPEFKTGNGEKTNVVNGHQRTLPILDQAA